MTMSKMQLPSIKCLPTPELQELAQAKVTGDFYSTVDVSLTTDYLAGATNLSPIGKNALFNALCSFIFKPLGIFTFANEDATKAYTNLITTKVGLIYGMRHESKGALFTPEVYGLQEYLEVPTFRKIYFLSKDDVSVFKAEVSALEKLSEKDLNENFLKAGIFDY